jgi:hypothetical protein
LLSMSMLSANVYQCILACVWGRLMGRSDIDPREREREICPFAAGVYRIK